MNYHFYTTILNNTIANRNRLLKISTFDRSTYIAPLGVADHMKFVLNVVVTERLSIFQWTETNWSITFNRLKASNQYSWIEQIMQGKHLQKIVKYEFKNEN